MIINQHTWSIYPVSVGRCGKLAIIYGTYKVVRKIFSDVTARVLLDYAYKHNRKWTKYGKSNNIIEYVLKFSSIHIISAGRPIFEQFTSNKYLSH